MTTATRSPARPARLGARWLAVALLALAAACGKSEPPKDAPKKAAGTSAAAVTAADGACTGADVHQRHLAQFDCAVCHPQGAAFGFDVPYTFPGGTTTAGGVIVPRTATSAPSCTVACHYPKGAPAHTVSWDTPGPLACTACHATSALPSGHPAVASSASRAECQGCHDVGTHATGDGSVTLVRHAAGWMDRASPAFHASSAIRGLASCRTCHAADLGGGVTGVACAPCHDRKDASGNVIVAWKADCVMCHGGDGGDGSGAPPAAIWGYAGDAARGGGTADPVRVGAHRAHLAGSALAPPYGCDVCHVKPADALADGHVDEVAAGATPIATLTFGGMAVRGLAPRGLEATWNRTTATCASTYCHGATLRGGTLKTPTWTTADGSQAACGTCHGKPPPSPHPTVDLAQGTRACSPCHAVTVDAAGAVIPPAVGGKHLDGVIEATGHAPEWMDRASAGFHAFSADANLASCQGCHGAALDGVGGTATTACASCHDLSLPAGVASWKQNCVMCHGGAETASGAPPKAIWGFAGDPARGGGTADPVRVGAHTAHVTGLRNGAPFSAPLDCAVCHPKPADALASGHADGTTADVAFSGLAAQGAPASPATWSRGTATCASVYCHGATLAGGTNKAPSWTGGAAEAACGTCHGAPPPASTGHVQNPACGGCHAGYTQTSVNAALHVNGTVDVGAMTCTSCHGDAARPATALNPQRAAAPPVDTAGHTASTSPGVGAHQAHLADGALGASVVCTECHVVPSTAAGHPTGAADLTFGPLATKDGAAPAYAGGACASTYCHGATLAGGTNRTPRWTGGPGEVACGTCPGLPPPAPHLVVSPELTGCNGCHPDTVDPTGAIRPRGSGGKHVDGTVQASGGGHGPEWMDRANAGFHAFSANRSIQACTGCHGATLDGGGASACARCHGTGFQTRCTGCHGGASDASGAPPRTTWGDTGPATVSNVRIGAHALHVTGTPRSPALPCSACHPGRTSAVDAGHADGATQVAFGGATGGGTWNRATATCASTYCHARAGARRPEPVWTQPQTSTCYDCHNQRSDSHHVWHDNQSIPCFACHLGYSDTSTDVRLHVNGRKDVILYDGTVITTGWSVYGACNDPANGCH